MKISKFKIHLFQVFPYIFEQISLVSVVITTIFEVLMLDLITENITLAKNKELEISKLIKLIHSFQSISIVRNGNLGFYMS